MFCADQDGPLWVLRHQRAAGDEFSTTGELEPTATLPGSEWANVAIFQSLLEFWSFRYRIETAVQLPLPAKLVRHFLIAYGLTTGAN